MTQNNYKAGEIRINPEDDLFTACIDKTDIKSHSGWHLEFMQFYTNTKGEAIEMQEKLVNLLNNMEW